MKLGDWLKINRENFGSTDLRFLIKTVLPEITPLIFEENYRLSWQKLQRLEAAKELYLGGMPLAYILGKECFFGLEFKVDDRVLIPRRETELIVEKAVSIINQNNLSYILDLCCGCGNIAVSIKKSAHKETFVFSSDISFDALRVAGTNKENNNQDISLINTDLFSGFKYDVFDLIVSNPPYVENKYIKGSLRHEPELALKAGSDGLFFIDRILNQAYLYLAANGYLIMEIGYNHKDFVDKFVNNTDLYELVEWIKDYSGHWRGIVLRNQ